MDASQLKRSGVTRAPQLQAAELALTEAAQVLSAVCFLAPYWHLNVAGLPHTLPAYCRANSALYWQVVQEIWNIQVPAVRCMAASWCPCPDLQCQV